MKATKMDFDFLNVLDFSIRQQTKLLTSAPRSEEATYGQRFCRGRLRP